MSDYSELMEPYVTDTPHYHPINTMTNSVHWVGFPMFGCALARAVNCQAKFGGLWKVMECHWKKCWPYLDRGIYNAVLRGTAEAGTTKKE